MKVFLDTNIFLEYFEQRREYKAVDKLLSAVEDGKVKAIVSVGCVYTLAYLITINLKDYSNADTAKVEILSPTEFVEKFL